MKNDQKLHAIFINFISKYNTIINQKVYSLLFEKYNLTKEEFIFKKCLHNKLQFKDEENNIYYFENGVN
jgi:hypothetical protein